MKQHGYQSIVFDLDGTLIDSSASILECFERVLKEANLQPVVPLDNSLIGPPLRQTLKNLTGLSGDEAVEELASNFQKNYDTEGYKATLAYPGVADLLAKLVSLEIPMAIATNKRRAPTLKILDHLGWEPYFKVVGTLDTPLIPHADKGALIGCVLNDMGEDAGNSLYLGDKWEDGEAAGANGMPFMAVGWGYGNWDGMPMPAGWQLIRSPSELVERLHIP